MTLVIVWTATTAITGDVKWDAGFERMDTATDIDADSFAAIQTVTTTAPGTSGFPAYSSIAFTNAQIDGLLVAEAFRLKITRNAAAAGDTMAGDAEALAFELRET